MSCVLTGGHMMCSLQGFLTILDPSRPPDYPLATCLTGPDSARWEARDAVSPVPAGEHH
jgi:hypothetical protein